ncbi:DUF833-domain-containing protein [Coemansia reversa NRRL 1564]|uniref:DUF833-domain-containing protein n=1 Tax=Coemansia reversa (strain ATCC 12441 / NRRL 1564) TaxID=763665 RepID=A0A2G5B6F0_COERN|nr:DUF833-domain-containing protein [Coemansia reversa NRRL 1564]|eukprot:PIA14585.1 DUF833-domain-containing protein [Coemansia reversa NRRL 1564]
MCIAFWRLGKGHKDGYNLVLMFNRDEYFERPTQGFHIWKAHPHICAPLDLKPEIEEHRGSWIGVNQQGRLALLTNYREKIPHHDDKISRGALVRDFLLDNPRTPGGQLLNLNNSDSMVMEYAKKIFVERELYDGFNLVLFDLQPEHMTAVYVTNRGDDGKGGRGLLRVLNNDSVTGLSNSTIDDISWPKVRHGKVRVSEILNECIDKVNTDKQDKQTITGLMELMRDTSPFNQEILPQQVDDLKECIFVPRLSGNIKILANESYGTRSTNVLLLRESKLTIAECNYANGKVHCETNADTSIMQFNLSF